MGTAWVLRFVKCLRKEKPEHRASSTLTLAELQQASQQIVQLIQRQSFREEYLALQRGQQVKRQNIALPPGVFAKEDLYSRKQWRHAQYLANCFWSRWIREYIPTLQQRQKWLLNKRNLSVNDLVLFVDNTVPRCRWLLGRVTKVFPGEDARVRTAEVKTKNSKLVRPVTKLCLLEEAT